MDAGLVPNRRVDGHHGIQWVSTVPGTAGHRSADPAAHEPTCGPRRASCLPHAAQCLWIPGVAAPTPTDNTPRLTFIVLPGMLTE